MTHSFPVVAGRWEERDGSIVQIVRDLGRRIAARGRGAPPVALTPMWRNVPPWMAACDSRAMRGVIVIVEREPELAAALAHHLGRERYETRVAHNAQDGLAATLRLPMADAVIVDTRLPDLPGVEVCRVLRSSAANRDVPVLVCGDDSTDERIAAFEAGADDVIAKPYSLRELVLRVGAILRRSHASTALPEPVSFGRLRVETETHRTFVDGQEVALTSLEFRLLLALLTRRGRVQTRDTLLADVWGIEADVTTRTVDTHVKRVRQKIGAVGAYVETLRGVGYRFRASPDDLR